MTEPLYVLFLCNTMVMIMMTRGIKENDERINQVTWITFLFSFFHLSFVIMHISSYLLELYDLNIIVFVSIERVLFLDRALLIYFIIIIIICVARGSFIIIVMISIIIIIVG